MLTTIKNWFNCLINGHQMSIKYWLTGKEGKKAFIVCKRCGKAWCGK